MIDESETISCGEHGKSQAAFVCEHLIAESVQRWYCNAPSEDNRWPDAWCVKCDAEFMKEGEWNEKNEKNVKIKLLCCECYEMLKGKSIDRLTDAAESEWNDFVARARDDMSKKQEQWAREFDINKHERWDWDQDTARLVFSNAGAPTVVCDIAFVGSVSTKSNTWLWSWANFSHEEIVREPLIPLESLGTSTIIQNLLSQNGRRTNVMDGRWPR